MHAGLGHYIQKRGITIYGRSLLATAYRGAIFIEIDATDFTGFTQRAPHYCWISVRFAASKSNIDPMFNRCYRSQFALAPQVTRDHALSRQKKEKRKSQMRARNFAILSAKLLNLIFALCLHFGSSLIIQILLQFANITMVNIIKKSINNH